MGNREKAPRILTTTPSPTLIGTVERQQLSARQKTSSMQRLWDTEQKWYKRFVELPNLKYWRSAHPRIISAAQLPTEAVAQHHHSNGLYGR